MLVKSAFPTPTIIIDKGKWLELIKDFFVDSISWITPSVSIKRTIYGSSGEFLYAAANYIVYCKRGLNKVGPDKSI